MVEGNVVKPIQTKFHFRTERHVGKVRTARFPRKTILLQHQYSVLEKMMQP
jgi:hypothetical protein